MHTALHLKYRPRTLNELTGQEYVQKTLINALQGDKIAPAYLFTGPRGTGKTSTARMFAKSLNCITSSKPTVHPCGKCQSCRSIDKSTSLDVAEIDAASNNGVDDARSLIERSSFAPAVGRYRIFILDECLAGDSLVLTDSGLVRIDNPAIIGKNVLSYNEANERWEFKPITRQWIKGNRHTLVIKTAVTEIRCTPEHLIRTNHGWKKAETIQPGDRILIAPTTFIPKSGSKSLNHCDPFVPVAVENAQRISFCSNGSNPLDIQLLSGVSRNKAKSTTLLDSQQSVVENGSNSSVSMLFQQWHTNSTCVKSVAWSGVAEPVYDLEVADNHNFVANGLLVHNCHQLTAQSQNALLKCIEEPPAHVIFIFCTTEPHKVLPTITSRCQVFNFRALSITAIVEQLRFVAQLESIAITDEALVALARTADGGLRDALQLLDQLSLLGVEITKNHVFELSGNVAESDLVAILQAIEKGNIFGLLQLSRSLLDNGKTPKLILSNLLTIYRDLLIVIASPKSQDLITGAIAYSQLKQLATPWDYEAVSTGLTQLQKSENQLRNAAQPHLWLEVCLLGLVTTRSEHSHNSNNSNGSMTALNPLGKSQPKAPTYNLSAIWNKVLESATPNNRSLLTHAELIELKSGKAVITVEARYFDKFNSNAKKVEKIFQKATGARVTIFIKERS